MDDAPFLLLDGPMGTELERRGVALPAPAWSAAALVNAPDVVRAIHQDYDRAGARVHTAATFRTTARALRDAPRAWRWDDLARRAVGLCRAAVSAGAQVAGSMAPLEDCYRPDLTPGDEALASEHGLLARCLADAGCDLLLVETIPTTRELVAAVQAAAATGLPVWAAVTPGPRGTFFDAAGVRHAQRSAAAAGASAFLINCSEPARITELLQALDPAAPPGRLGAYGNLLFGKNGPAENRLPNRYAAHAREWQKAGASILGGCCGAGPDHIRSMAQDLPKRPGGNSAT